MEGWIAMLEKYDVYFSSPLDIDFAMLTKFKEKYIATLSSGEGPLIKGYGKIQNPEIPDGSGDEYQELLNKRIASDVHATLKDEGGDGSTYSDGEKELMIWYNFGGCKFASRCPDAEKRCFCERPEGYETEGRIVRCFQYA